MRIAMVTSQVLNVRVIVFLEAVVSHEASMIGVDVSVSSCAIDMVMQSLWWTSAFASSCDMLRSVA